MKLIFFNRRIFFMMVLFISADPLTNEPFMGEIPEIENYFPDEIGRRWIYQGSIADGVQQISSYTNTTIVQGIIKKKGREVKLFSETNQANQGPAERYFEKKQEGLFYYGGSPSTLFEGRLIPYPLLHFPLTLHEAFTQLKKTGIPFGRDLDQDGIEEMADVTATAVADSFESVSVPAGLFKNALKIKAIMTIRLFLSGGGEPVELLDKTINWFALGIGMVKGIESVEFPAIGSLPSTATVIREQLSSYSEAH